MSTEQSRRTGATAIAALPFPAIEAELRARLAAGENGAVTMTDLMLEQAAAHRASDVHIEPWADGIAIRYRIDGILHLAALLPKENHGRVVGRIKVLGRMLSYQRDLPQDGRIDPENTPFGRAMRVSTFPTVDGEKIVIRLLGTDPALLGLERLGFPPETTAALRRIVVRPQGTLLLTGPASSGKTTTIYALLQEILEARAVPGGTGGATAAPHVVTIEDPVECRIGRVSQTEIEPHAGFTFEAALRAVLRQDPEVIMVGEIRDAETARIAVQAGLTGHLVISTIHSGAAAGVFTRLLDMGVEPYLVSSSITGVLAQRLVRRNCPDCLEPYSPDPALRRRFGLDGPEPIEFRRGRGCDACQNLGFRGRTAVGELLLVDESLEDLLLTRPRTHRVHEAALEAGMVPLAAAAAAAVRANVTTLEEISRVMAGE